MVGDITLTHTGNHHDWFHKAQADPTCAEAGFYMFGDGPDDYVSWHDVPSLPKLDHRSSELADRLYRGPGSVIARYLDPPFELDGWRVDCANTTARWADVDVNHDVATATRSTMDGHGGGWLIAEHCFDAGADLVGDGWHGVMAYQWFSRPIWSWLRGDRAFSLMAQTDLPRLDGANAVDAMRTLGANVPWASRSASMTMIDSHDSARFLTAVGGDERRHRAGLAALLTMPGVPTLFAGSEVGVEGDSMDSCRVPFPWDESRWNRSLLEAAAALVELRRSSDSLRRGGLRWLDAAADSITYVRELPGEATLVHLTRADTDPLEVDLADLDLAATADGAVRYGSALIADGRIRLDGDVPATVVTFHR